MQSYTKLIKTNHAFQTPSHTLNNNVVESIPAGSEYSWSMMKYMLAKVVPTLFRQEIVNPI